MLNKTALVIDIYMYENFVRHGVLWDSLLHLSFLSVCGEVSMSVYWHIERPEVLIKFLPQTISFFGNRFSLNLILPIQMDWLAGKPKIVKIWHHKCVLSVSSFLHECWYPNLCPAPWGTNTAEKEYPQSNSHSGWHQLSLLYFHPVCLFFGWHDTWSHTSCFLSRWCLS